MARRSTASKARGVLVTVLTLVGVVLSAAAPAAADTVYVVRPGDTLSTIAKRNGVPTRELAAANSITNHHLIKVGQKLTIPSSGQGGPAAQVYKVVAGDTLSGIAKRFGIRSADLAARNGITDPHRIRIGQKLAIPAGGVPAAPAVSRYPSLPARIKENPDRLAFVESFERWASHYGVPNDLLMAICYQESGWQASIVSNKGAIGIGQVLPGTAAWVARDLIGVPGLDVNRPDDNIRISARFLRWLIAFHGNEDLAIAGYYQGPTSIVTKGIFPQTEAYVAAVQAGRWRFQPS